MHNLLQHLTNSSLNKLSSDFVTSENLYESTTRPLSIALEQLASEQGIDPQLIQDSIAEVCTKSLIAMQPYMLFEQENILREVGGGAKSASAELRGDCYQILGFDILIDS